MNIPPRFRCNIQPIPVFLCCCTSHCGVHSLNSNNVGAKGAAAIAEALKSNSTLQQLE